MKNWLFDIRSRSFVLLTALFLFLTSLVFFELTDDFDQNVILFFSENVGNSTLDLVMQYVTESGDVFNMMMFAIIILLIPKTRRVGITLLILIVISTLLTGYKNAVSTGIDLVMIILGLNSPYKLVVIHLHYFVKVALTLHTLLAMQLDQ